MCMGDLVVIIICIVSLFFRIACLQKWMGMCGSSATYKVLLDVFLQTENEEAAKVIVKVLGDKPVAGN